MHTFSNLQFLLLSPFTSKKRKLERKKKEIKSRFVTSSSAQINLYIPFCSREFKCSKQENYSEKKKNLLLQLSIKLAEFKDRHTSEPIPSPH